MSTLGKSARDAPAGSRIRGLYLRSKNLVMRVKVVRTPGEVRDSIGHKVVVKKDWEGAVESELAPDEVALAGFNPKQSETFYAIKFDRWEQTIVLPATLVVVTQAGAPEVS